MTVSNAEDSHVTREPSAPTAGYLLRVARIIRETADACSIVLEIPDEFSALFRYRAGQFVTLRVPFEGKDLSRSYSLASSPDVEREHKITVKRVADGRISNWLNENLCEGDRIRVLPPGGVFVLDDHSTRPLVLLAAGSGITPIISLIKSALVRSNRDIRLFYANRDAASVIFNAEIETLAKRHPRRLDVVHHFDTDRGFLAAATVVRWAQAVHGADFYVCGPSGFMDVVQAGLLEAGVPDERIRIERFVSPPDPTEIREAPAPNAVDARVSVYLDGRTHEVTCRPGETVLAAVQREGLEPPFSCTDGFCGCCMARLRAGRVRMIKNDFLSERELKDGWVLTCQSVPDGDGCNVEYPD